MSKTQDNIMAAFTGESMARNKYAYYAEMAGKEGYHYIAKIFEETAENEKYQALEELRDFARLTGKNDVHLLSVNDLVTTNSEISGYSSIEHV